MKNYILDTTVLLHDPYAFFAFEKSHVIIPIDVIEDIDDFKKDITEKGRNARQVSRYLDESREHGQLFKGVTLENGAVVSIDHAQKSYLQRVPSEFRDNKKYIIAIALHMMEEEPDNVTVIVTKDINLRVKADALGIKVEDYESEKVDINELYPGYSVAGVTQDVRKKLATDGRVKWDGEQLYPNEYVCLTDGDGNDGKKEYGWYHAQSHTLRSLIKKSTESIWNIKANNEEQLYALDALLRDDLQLVTLVGKAGTGKTLLAIAAAMYQTIDEDKFQRILVSRPTLPMGKDIGYLPGNIEEKLVPWMYPIADNVEFILRKNGRSSKGKSSFKELINTGILVIEPLTYIRGRSIHNQYLIVDEAQNLTPHEMKTIITRVGEGTKIVVTGDPYQIDNPYIDSSSNGLAYIVEKFKNESLTATVTLKKGERSNLSELAANLL